MTAPRRAILVFLDGVGIGARDPAYNPFAAAHLPRLEALLGRSLDLVMVGAMRKPRFIESADQTRQVAFAA